MLVPNCSNLNRDTFLTHNGIQPVREQGLYLRNNICYSIDAIIIWIRVKLVPELNFSNFFCDVKQALRKSVNSYPVLP